MSIITISRGSYSKGKEIAEKVAERLGYECISRDIVLEASEEFHIPEIHLIRAIHDAPSILDRLSIKKDRFTSYYKTALLEHMRKDNVVYHGLAGHFFVKDIPHALKIRVIADIEERARLEMDREGITREEALHILKKDDEERRKWSQYCYGVDTRDCSLYDLVVNINQITVEHAVDLICETVKLKEFQTTPESQRLMEDLVLSEQVHAALMNTGYNTDVCVENGVAFVKLIAPISQEVPLVQKIDKTAMTVAGVKDVRVDVVPMTPFAE